MCKIGRIEAFSLVLKALEKGDSTSADRLTKIIMKSIRQSKDLSPSNVIEIRDTKDIRFIERIKSQ